MIQYYAPVFLIIMANGVYHICAKSIPNSANSFIPLFVTYTIAAIFSLLLFFFTSNGENLGSQFKALNWAPFVFGLALVLLEFGNILLYRVGWNMSVGSLVCSIGLALLLILIGILVYKETITFHQIIGIGLCVLGLIFINMKTTN